MVMNSSSTTKYYGASCTHPAFIFKMYNSAGQNINFLGNAASSLTSRQWPNKTLIINNGAINRVKPTAKALPIHADETSPLRFLVDAKYSVVSAVDELHVNWTDFGVPPVGKEYWEYLVEQIVANDYQTVACTCTGGHGRTGTALACLSAVVLKLNGAEAVNFVRKNYCTQALETVGQENYLIRLFGGKAADIVVKKEKGHA